MSDHHHEQQQNRKNIHLALFLNIAFTGIEVVGGLWTNSLAILSDALHDFGDSIALGASAIAERYASKPSDEKRTFGYRRLPVFSALFSAGILLSGSLYILFKAIPRLFDPQHVNAQGMILIAIAGVVFNGLGFLRLRKGSAVSVKVLSWHLLEDVMGWVVILFGALLALVWDNHLIDPLLTIGFTIYIMWGVSKNVREAFNILLQGVPAHINMEEMKKDILALKGVETIHDIHVWSFEGETDVFTGHIVLQKNCMTVEEKIKSQIKTVLQKCHIEHSTIEIEYGTTGDDVCALD